MSGITSDRASAAAGASQTVSADAPAPATSADATRAAVAPAATSAAPTPRLPRSAACAIALVLGAAYVAYFVWFVFVRADGMRLLEWIPDALRTARVIGDDDLGQLISMGAGLVGLLYAHFALTVAGLLCNLLALVVNRAGVALAAALCYAMAALAFCIYLPLVLPELMLCCTAFGSMRERQRRSRAARRAGDR